jgi:hypothetical protein
MLKTTALGGGQPWRCDHYLRNLTRPRTRPSATGPAPDRSGTAPSALKAQADEDASEADLDDAIGELLAARDWLDGIRLCQSWGISLDELVAEWRRQQNEKEPGR